MLVLLHVGLCLISRMKCCPSCRKTGGKQDRRISGFTVSGGFTGSCEENDDEIRPRIVEEIKRDSPIFVNRGAGICLPSEDEKMSKCGDDETPPPLERELSEDQVDFGKAVGRGSFGCVFRGRGKEDGSLLAVKEILFPDDLTESQEEQKIAEMENELCVLRMVDHPNIVRYRGHEVLEDSPPRLHIFLEFIPGDTVKSQLDEFGAFSTELVRKYAFSLVSAVSYLHGFDPPIVHRDLKTTNMLLSQDGEIKIVDFGCAVIRRITNTDNCDFFRGTLCYLPPEVYGGGKPACAQDVWSLGCCILEMCTARRPWWDWEMENIVDAYRIISLSTAVPTPPGNRPKNLLDFLYNECLVRDPEMRTPASILLHHDFLIRREPEIRHLTHLRERMAPVRLLSPSTSRSRSHMSLSTIGSGSDLSQESPSSTGSPL